jgi:hypothetical protein
MEQRLHFLESFPARGSDGASYKVCGYERLAPDAQLTHGEQRWESTGVSEYRLDDGRLVEVDRNGVMRITGSDVVLEPVATRH